MRITPKIDTRIASVLELLTQLSPSVSPKMGFQFSRKLMKLIRTPEPNFVISGYLKRLMIMSSYVFLSPDPLRETPPNEIAVIMPIGPRDRNKYIETLESVLSNVSNPIHSISLICPREFVISTINDCEKFKSNVRIKILAEEDLLVNEVSTLIENRAPYDRIGWYRQQVVKWFGVLQSSTEFNLLVDSDTRFTKPRNWCSGSSQILTPVYERHLAYMEHLKRVWRTDLDLLVVSFVSHHQLVQKSKLAMMLDEIGGTDNGVKAWISQIERRDSSGASEFESYATWLINRFPHTAVLARWGNFSNSSRGHYNFSSKRRRKLAWSISKHWYQG